MPAQLSANPIKVGSADGIPVTVFKGSAKIRAIEYSRYTAGSTGAVVNDINGNEICALVPDTATTLETLRTPSSVGYVTGLVVAACPSGEVNIYFE